MALDLGYQLLQSGYILRYLPDLVRARACFKVSPPPLNDEICFVRQHFGNLWTAWAILSAAGGRLWTLPQLLLAWRRVFVAGETQVSRARSREYSIAPLSPQDKQIPVSVIIPTIDRYSFLQTLLDQMRCQTVVPCEILVVDQTPGNRRERGLEKKYPDLPLKVITLDQAGQCSSRNAAIQQAQGKYLLFLDDDVEVYPGLIEDHLMTIRRFHADTSSGAVRR